MDTQSEKNHKPKIKSQQQKLELFVVLLFTTLIIVVLWPFFTTTVEAGHTGAYYSRFFGGTLTDKSYGEGLHFVLPWDAIIPYDSRAQSNSYSITALAKGGLKVTVEMSVIWYINRDKVGDLHKTMGPDYPYTVINPSVVSVVRSVIGGYDQNQLYDGNPIKLQDDVKALLDATLIQAPFIIHSILIREVKLPAPMAGAIEDKFVSEQNVLAERYRVLEAVERFKRSYVDAEAVRLSQSIVNDGMSEAYLRFRGIEATLELAKSNNAKLVIIGDKDGLPLILNPGDMQENTTLPEGISPDEYIVEEGARVENFLSTYDEIIAMLEKLSVVSEQVSDRFPAADESINESMLPQESTVPTKPNGVE